MAEDVSHLGPSVAIGEREERRASESQSEDESFYKINFGDDVSDALSATAFSDSGLDDSLAEMSEDLETDAQRLIGPDPLLRKPIPNLSRHSEKQPIEGPGWTSERVFCDKVQQRFPKAKISLTERLGKTNWERYLRCQNMRKAAESEHHDSSLGTSLPTATSHVKTVITYIGDNGQRTLIPPLSEPAREGRPFLCLACGRVVRINSYPAWKHHLDSDLQPYSCLEPRCWRSIFDDRSNWVQHLAFDHNYSYRGWRAVTCPLCLGDAGNGHLAVTNHLARHLEEISLSTLPLAVSRGEDEGVFEHGFSTPCFDPEEQNQHDPESPSGAKASESHAELLWDADSEDALVGASREEHKEDALTQTDEARYSETPRDEELQRGNPPEQNIDAPSDDYPVPSEIDDILGYPPPDKIDDILQDWREDEINDVLGDIFAAARTLNPMGLEYWVARELDEEMWAEGTVDVHLRRLWAEDNPYFISSDEEDEGDGSDDSGSEGEDGD